MANTKEIKRRMQSIANTKQITNAMKMVSASKLRKAQTQTGSAHPYRDRLQSVVARVAQAASNDVENPLLTSREVDTEGFLILGSNKGLAGGYNSHLLNHALVLIEEAKQEGRKVAVIAVGRKVDEFFRKRDIPIIASFLDTQDVPTAADSDRIAKAVNAAYTGGQVDKVTLVYQSFKSAISQTPYDTVLLPIEVKAIGEGKQAELETVYESEFVFEPSAEEILASLLPLYMTNQIFSALSEAKVGEHGARMTAMTAATDNATELIEKLSISYNRARQTAITNEISEIVAGADAL